ncbi:MAG TPA: hypothetical protein VFX35_04075 [Solirubrobacterales bacterium]|nr:hypothetical protein [Solirubrobacterales bacterium]
MEWNRCESLVRRRSDRQQDQKRRLTTNKLTNGAVTSGKLGDDAVAGGKLADGR